MGATMDGQVDGVDRDDLRVEATCVAWRTNQVRASPARIRRRRRRSSCSWSSSSGCAPAGWTPLGGGLRCDRARVARRRIEMTASGISTTTASTTDCHKSERAAVLMSIHASAMSSPAVAAAGMTTRRSAWAARQAVLAKREDDEHVEPDPRGVPVLRKVAVGKRDAQIAGPADQDDCTDPVDGRDASLPEPHRRGIHNCDATRSRRRRGRAEGPRAA